MALFDVITKEKIDDKIIWKYPKNKFSTSSQLIVHESQEALFFSNGKALDLFGPGKYTLQTDIIPLLNKIIQIPTGFKSPFRSEVYFIDKSEQTSRWGTSSKIQFLDPVYKFPLEIGACGEMRFVIDDSRKLILKLVGINKNFDSTNIDDFFSSQILMKVKTYIAQIITTEKISIFELDQQLEKFSDELQKKLEKDFEEFGIKLKKFFVTTIRKPEEDRQYLEFKELYFKQTVALAEAELKQKLDIIEEDTKAQKAIIESNAMATKRRQEGYSYQEEHSYKIGEKVAENEAMGQFTNMGVGLGMMSGIGSSVSEKVNNQVTGAFATVEDSIICPNCNTRNSQDTIFCKKCGTKFIKERKCKSCGNKLDDDSIFCGKCGERVG